MIVENLHQIESNIKATLNRVGRNESEVTLIAVSKTKPVSYIEEAIRGGALHFGENKVQELCDKYDCLPHNIKWHLIGHLQRNKVKYIVDKVNLIHSIDSLRLAQEVSRQASIKNIVVDILIQINVADESTKFGIDLDNAERLIREIARLSNINIIGLMTIAPYTENSEDNRIYFRNLYKLFVDIKHKNIDNVSMDVLSMGMSGDYEVAIEEGATMVRVGTGIFGDRIYLNKESVE
jgi:pyridoxal phosphate enzyme (YggS family)